MKLEKLKNIIFAENAPLKWMLLATVVVLFAFLGGRELWTQEWRWADISWYMIYTKDYFHPYLAGNPYYDKPLLSYWLMILFSHVVAGLNEWALRLPAALAGLLAIYCTYQIGTILVNRKTGLLAAWMLASTYFFVFWARTANSDMLNLAGTLLAISWYFTHKEKNNFFSYLIFFTILAITALFKGLIGIIIPGIAILPDLVKEHRWKQHLNVRLILALIPAVMLYLLPFWLSDHFGNQHYGESGLYEVYRENILRYFQPFDHEGPIYTYLIYLPIYMLPWALFFIPAIFSLKKRWLEMNSGSRWMVWSTLFIFLFLTFSGSRRSYYVLPLVPFAMLMTADWITSAAAQAKRYQYAIYTFALGYLVVLISFCVVQPLYYASGGERLFAQTVQKAAGDVRPWSQWNIVLLDARSRLAFYLDSSRPVQLLDKPGDRKTAKNYQFTQQELITKWPIILKPTPNTIFVTRELYFDQVKGYFKNYKIINSKPLFGERLLHTKDLDNPVAFVPVG